MVEMLGWDEVEAGCFVEREETRAAYDMNVPTRVASNFPQASIRLSFNCGLTELDNLPGTHEKKTAFTSKFLQSAGAVAGEVVEDCVLRTACLSGAIVAVRSAQI